MDESVGVGESTPAQPGLDTPVAEGAVPVRRAGPPPPNRRLTPPQRSLLAEIRDASHGVLYVSKWKRYARTVAALQRRGLVEVVEHDHSSLGMDGYRITPAGEDALR